MPQSPVEDSVRKVNEEVAVGEDLAFQRSWWRFERGVWMLFTALIALDLAGAFGRGPLANAHAATADRSLQVRYERILRTGTPSTVTISCGPQTTRQEQLTLFISDEFVSGLGAQRIIPEPASTRIGAGGLTYLFPVRDTPAVVRIELQPPHAGRFHFTISAGSGQTVAATAWVVP